jgi:formate dehydrogenase maturation protein FdhE
VGLQQTLQYEIPTNIPVKNATLNNKRSMVRIQSDSSCNTFYKQGYQQKKPSNTEIAS